MAKQTKKDVLIAVAVEKTGSGAKDANKELKKLEGGFKKATREASKLTIKSAALDAKQKQLGKAVASGEMSVKKAAKAYTKFAEKMDKTAKASQGANAAQSKSKGILEVAKENWLALAGGVAAAGIAIKTAKELFDFATEGAAIQQLEESFIRLNESVFKTPNLLDDMTDATRGTVSPMKLMKGVMTLTAGASDEMAQEFAKASPKLAEIAKAAQKLNPTLGDTAFLYDSIATGIKRSSPLILDNLGIVVKIGKANEDYAEILGKTVEELSGMEKQQALLNATLEAGDQLIRQVGGDVGSGMDKYAQLSTAVDVLKDGFKSLAADALGPVVGLFADLLIQAKEARELREITATAQDVARNLLEVYDDIIDIDQAMKDAQKTFTQGFGKQEGFGVEDFGFQIEQFRGEAQLVFFENLSKSIEAVPWKSYQEHIDFAMDQANLALVGHIVSLDEAKVAAQKLSDEENDGLTEAALKTEQLTRRQEESTREAERRQMLNKDARVARRMDADLEREMVDLRRINLGIQDEARELAAELTEEEEKLKEEAEAAAEEIEELVRELEKAARVRFSTGATTQLKALTAAAEAGTEITTNLNNVMFESAVAAGVDGIAYLELARATGLYTDEQIRNAIRAEAMKQKAEDLGRAIADGAISVSDAIEELEKFSETLDRVPTHKTVNFELNLPPIPDWLQNQITAELSVPQFPTDRPGGPTGHAGLSGIVPSGFPNDSFPIMVESGERVLVQTKAQQAAGVDVNGNQVGGRGQGGTKIMHSKESNVFYVPDQSTARFVTHQIDEARRQRYEDFMGKG